MATPSTSPYSPSAYDPSALYGRFGASPPKGVKRNPDDPETGNQTTPGASPATSQSPAATPTPQPQTNVGAPPPPPSAAPAPAGGSPGQPLGSTPMAGAPAAAPQPQNPFRTIAPTLTGPGAAPSGRINEFTQGDGNANGITGSSTGSSTPPDQNPGLSAIGAGFNPASGGPSAPQTPPAPIGPAAGPTVNRDAFGNPLPVSYAGRGGFGANGPQNAAGFAQLDANDAALKSASAGGYDRSQVDLNELNRLARQSSGSSSMTPDGKVTGNDSYMQLQGKALRGEPLTHTERAYLDYRTKGGGSGYFMNNNPDGSGSMSADSAFDKIAAKPGGAVPGTLPPTDGSPLNPFDQIAPPGARSGPPPAPNFTNAGPLAPGNAVAASGAPGNPAPTGPATSGVYTPPTGPASTDPYFPTGNTYAQGAPGTPSMSGPGNIGPGPGSSPSNSGDPHLDALMSQFGVHGGPASRFDDPVIRQAWDRMSGNIDDQYDTGDRAQRADLARRGISDSTAGSAILRGRNVDRRTAKEDQATQLAIASASARNADLTGATNRALGMYGAGQGTNRFNQTFGHQKYMDKNYYDANRQDAYDRLMMQMFGAGQ